MGHEAVGHKCYRSSCLAVCYIMLLDSLISCSLTVCHQGVGKCDIQAVGHCVIGPVDSVTVCHQVVGPYTITH